MGIGFQQMVTQTLSVLRKARVHRSLLVLVPAVLLLQSYFIQVLLASELFFALAFAGVFSVFGAAYLIGSVGTSWLKRKEGRGQAVLNEGGIE